MPEKVTLHYKDGSTTEMDAVDARRTLRDHPSEWSAAPFPEDIQRREAENTRNAAAAEEARRAEAARKAQEEADEKARKEQAQRDAEASRIAAQQAEKAKADEEARNRGFSAPAVPTPVTNDGLAVGHIPSEVPALNAPTAPYEARDKGHGWWGIFDSKGTPIGESIRKDDAAAFNEMSDEDKEEYVKAELAKS